MSNAAFDLFDAFRSLGMPEDKARTAAEAVLQTPDRRFDQIDARFDHLEARFDERFERIEERFEKVDQRFVKVDARFASVEADIVRLRLDVGVMKWMSGATLGLVILVLGILLRTAL